MRLSIFLFFLSCLLLLAPRSFWRSDGYIEYSVARQAVLDGELDIPEFAGGDAGRRVQRGTDGRVFATYGLGQSLLYVATFYADGVLRAAYGPARVSGGASAEPGFFSTTANAWVTALLALCLIDLLGYFGAPLGPRLFTVLLFVFGTMALVYAGLSFDVVLSTLLLLGTFLVLFRSFPQGRISSSLAAGLLFGGAFLTRPANLLFAIPAGYFVAVRLRALASERRPAFSRLVALVGGAAVLIAVQCWYNWYRFGSLLDFGYDSGLFTASLAVSLPALLVSPGRGIVFFAAPAILGLFGVRMWLRRHPAEARTLIAVAALNLFFHALWYWWATPLTWGPRFQYLTIAILMVPLGLWLSAGWDKTRGTRAMLLLAFFAVSFSLHAAASLVGFLRLGADFSEFWAWRDTQVVELWMSTTRMLRNLDVRSLQSWWVNPSPSAIPGPAATLPLLLLALVSGGVIILGLKRQRGADRAAEASGGAPLHNG